MSRFCRSSVAAAVLLVACPLQAKTYIATAANLKSIFGTVISGDLIRLSGSFDGATLQNRSFGVALTIDARNATFTDALALSNVGGIDIWGGNYGNATKAIGTAVRVSKSDRINFKAPVVVGDKNRQIGISVSLSSNIAIDQGSFTNLRLGVGFTTVTGGKITNSRVTAATSDGFDIADSHNVLVSRNTCSGTAITPGAHPDCVQLWSIAGQPRQSDIEISDNTAIGATQGFTSFDEEAGGGLRIKILRNRIDTSYPQGIACYGCDDSQFIGNILTTQSGAQWQTTMNIFGTNNIISGNSIGARPASSALGAFDNAFAGAVVDDGALGRLAGPMSDSIAAIPEPATWATLLLGFGAIGMAARRIRRVALD